MRALLATVLLLSCRARELTIDGVGFSIDAPAVFIARVGTTTSQELTLHSSSQTAQDVRLAVAPPFAVAPQSLILEAGASTAVTVSFTAAAIGSVTRVLAAGAVTVALGGRGVQCASAPACQIVSDDCSTLPAPDGSACTATCLTAGSCVAGACVGAARSCDDGDACTADICDALAGCAHAPVQCPAATDPCRIAFCDPTTGCSARPADDGTACGDSDCMTSNVCIAGTCVQRATPEGSACGNPSPCQALGTCSGQTCVRPPPQLLGDAWSYTGPGTDWNFDFPGIADSDGNLYWWESVSGAVAQSIDHVLVSTDRDGNERYRAPIDLVPQPIWLSTPGTMLLSGDLVLMTEYSALFSSTMARLEARDRNSGALVWSLDFAALEHSTDPCLPGGSWGGVMLGAPASDAQSGLFVKVNRWCGNDQPAGADLFFVDLTSGTAGWHVSGLPNWGSVVADEAGNAYVLTSDTELTSWDRTGHERWRRTVVRPVGPSSSPMAVYGGRFVFPTGDAMALASGTVWQTGTPPLWQALNGASPVISATLVGVFTRGSIGDPLYEGHDVATGALQWSASLFGAYAASQPVLTQSGSTLMMTAERHNFIESLWLTEISNAGRALFRCQVSGTSDNLSSPTLRGGRYTIALVQGGTSVVRAFDLPGREPATHGWVTAAGKMTKESRPR
jgi:hypothetical protein